MPFLLGIVWVVFWTYICTLLPLPWWAAAGFAGLGGFILRASGWQSFLYGLLGAALVWGGKACLIDNANGGLLSGRMAELFGLGAEQGGRMVLATALLGGILCGLAALSGALLRWGILPPQPKNRRRRRRRRRRR